MNEAIPVKPLEYSDRAETGVVALVRLVVLAGMIDVALTLMHVCGYGVMFIGDLLDGAGRMRSFMFTSWLGIPMVIQFLAGLGFLAAGAGCLRFRSWARTLLLITACALIVTELPVMISRMMQYMSAPYRSAPRLTMATYATWQLAGGLRAMVIPALLLVMMTRRAVRGLFAGD